jgi:hypothetical protein
MDGGVVKDGGGSEHDIFYSTGTVLYAESGCKSPNKI